ncbi:hypothetical protein MMC13_004244 [Lambiella insularis]|nr:hypothetical protein [Lambiella insularis]
MLPRESSRGSPPTQTASVEDFRLDPALLESLFAGQPESDLLFGLDANSSQNIFEAEASSDDQPDLSTEPSGATYEEVLNNFIHYEAAYEYPDPANAETPIPYPVTSRTSTSNDGLYMDAAIEQYSPLSDKAILAILNGHLRTPVPNVNPLPISHGRNVSGSAGPSVVNHDIPYLPLAGFPPAESFVAPKRKSPARRPRSLMTPDLTASSSGSVEAPIKVRKRNNNTETPWAVPSKPDSKNSRRTAVIKDFNSVAVYYPLPQPLPSWSSMTGMRFQYELSGELKEGQLLSVREMAAFLHENPRRGYGMTLWIQRNPADSARRYPTATSNRCRFRHCLSPDHCINQGNYRVSLDELTATHPGQDPFHNAGYVHLYCLEKYFDFPQLVRDLDVRADERNLPNEPKGKNGMALGTAEERQAAREFVRDCKRTHDVPYGYPRFGISNRPYEGWLCHTLSEQKLAWDRSLQRIMRERGVKKSTIGFHKGNLEIEAAERHKTRLAKNQVQRTTNSTRNQPKRKAAFKAVEDSDDVDADGDEDYEEEAPRPAKRQRTTSPKGKAPVKRKTPVEEDDDDEEEAPRRSKRRRVVQDPEDDEVLDEQSQWMGLDIVDLANREAGFDD